MTLKQYPFLRIALFFIPGTALGMLTHSDKQWVLVSILFCSAIFFLSYFKKSRFIENFAIYGLILGFGWLIGLHQKSIHPSQNMERITGYTARIKSAPEKKPKTYKALAEILSIRKDSSWQKTHFDLLLYFEKDSTHVPGYGDIYLINGSPREIEPPKNPYEFDYKDFQLKRAVTAHHFLRKADFTFLGAEPMSLFMKKVYGFNKRAVGILQNICDNTEDLGIAEAMLTGTKDDLDTELREAYAAAGAVHILAVSGLHVGIIMLMLNFLLKPILRLKNGRLIFGLLSISLLWLYAIFTGLSPSVVRATLMFSLFQLGELISRNRNSINTLAASAVILLIIRPNWLFEVGFQLSYLAIFGIIFLYPKVHRWWEPKNFILNNLWQISVVSVSAQLFTFPLSLYYFHQFPNYFLITNPLVTVGSMAVLMLGIPAILLHSVPYLGEWLSWLFSRVLSAMNFTVKEIAALPYSTSSGFNISPFELILLFALIFLFIQFFLKKEPRLFYAIGLLSVLLFGFNSFKDLKQMKQSEITFHFIPKGSGISIIQSKNATFLCDSITAFNPRAYGFHLKNYYDARGVNFHETIHPSLNSEMLEFDVSGKKYLWIRKYNRSRIKHPFDKVMISNNAVVDLNKTFGTFPSEILLDDTNSKRRILNLQAQADSLGIPLISLYETGGVICKY